MSYDDGLKSDPFKALAREPEYQVFDRVAPVKSLCKGWPPEYPKAPEDPRSAQQIGAVVVLPLVAIIVGQIAGFFFLTPRLALLGAAVLTVIDACVLAAGVAAFQRETILTRWK